jgi:hypothetical protein
VRGKGVVARTISDANATVDAYKKALVGNFAAVGFVGHSTLGNGPEYPSIGMRFFDKSLVKWPEGVQNPQLANGGPAEWVQQTVPFNTPLLFLGACALGNEFLSLWGISNQTHGEAIILVRANHTRNSTWQAEFE